MSRTVIRIASIIAAVLTLGMFARDPDAPVSIDWHIGSRLFVLHSGGAASIVDENTGRKLLTIPPVEGLQPADIVAARVQGVDYVFVSGFVDRSGVILQYSVLGKKLATFGTPEQAVSFDIDPGTAGRRVLYLASAVTNNIYTLDLDGKSRKADRLTVIKDARSIGPLLFDAARRRLFVGDSGSGNIYEVDTKGACRLAATGAGRPISLALDSTGSVLYAADAATGRLVTFNCNRPQLTLTGSVETRLSNLIAVATGPDRTLYVADTKKGIFQLTPATGLLKPL